MWIFTNKIFVYIAKNYFQLIIHLSNSWILNWMNSVNFNFLTFKESKFIWIQNSTIWKLNCFLMPHPGLVVCTSPEFDGKLKDIQYDFKAYVKKFVESTFTPNVSAKQINGREISTFELYEYFKAYCRVFEADELPEPKSMLLPRPKRTTWRQRP